jgi:hypothetical protein
MASTVGWLIIGIVLIGVAVYVTFMFGRRVRDPEYLVALVEEAASQGRGAKDPDVRRSALRWPALVPTVFWCAALFPWPRTIDHLMRGEWNVVTSGPESPWADAAGDLLFGGIWLVIVLGFVIHYWNQPKFLVHPYFRGDPGLLAARRMRAQGVDVDDLYRASAERWRARHRRRGGKSGTG